MQMAETDSVTGIQNKLRVIFGKVSCSHESSLWCAGQLKGSMKEGKISELLLAVSITT
jgi:hypothetical protein